MSRALLSPQRGNLTVVDANRCRASVGFHWTLINEVNSRGMTSTSVQDLLELLAHKVQAGHLRNRKDVAQNLKNQSKTCQLQHLRLERQHKKLLMLS